MDMQETTYRAIVAKPGLDGHDRGARVIARALRDAGIEVIYTGLHQTPEMIVTACRQEDPDVLLLSILSGAHLTLIPRIIEAMKEAGLDDTPVLAGGIIPDEDAEKLEAAGVHKVMGPGSDTNAIAALVHELGRERRAKLEAGNA
jgi:methylmalonyl-CoA mutase C-terminal domain/subunit